MTNLNDIADRLIAAYDTATTLPPITAGAPNFSVADGYAVLHDIETRRRAQGWRPVGRKIGFTNRTIWPRYGVYQPMWAHTWSHTVHFATDGQASLPLHSFVRPRIEPEVVFKLKAPVPLTDDPLALLSSVEWIAPGFEIVQSHFPDWKFTAADCAAAFGLHGALVVGAPVSVTDANRAKLAAALPTVAVTLSRGGQVIDLGASARMSWAALRWRSPISPACWPISPRPRSLPRARSSPPARSPTPGRSRPARSGHPTMARWAWTA